MLFFQHKEDKFDPEEGCSQSHKAPDINWNERLAEELNDEYAEQWGNYEKGNTALISLVL